MKTLTHIQSASAKKPRATARPTLREECNLVTGASGFAGCFLVDALRSRGASVVGLSRRGIWPARWAHLGNQIKLHAADLAEANTLANLLRELRPTRIYHLAGFSHPGQSMRQPEAAWHDNLQASERLYNAVLDSGLRPRIVHVSSGLVYGHPDDDSSALDESSPLAPQSPYAHSKAAADELGQRYHRDYGLEIVVARPFNHTGPTQSAQFAVPSFARQLAGIAVGTLPPVLETGNLDVERDLSDVSDIVDAYIGLMDHGIPGEVYNIGSGRSAALRWVVEHLIELSGTRVEIRPRPDLFRKGEPACIRVNADKLRRQTRWAPRHTLEETLAETLAAWKRRTLDVCLQE